MVTESLTVKVTTPSPTVPDLQCPGGHGPEPPPVGAPAKIIFFVCSMYFFKLTDLNRA